MKPPLLEKASNNCEKRKGTHCFRTIPEQCSDDFIQLSTNSYLALHKNETVLKRACDLTGDFLSGNLSSRLLYQNSPLFTLLERELAEWKNCESALVFNSGYAANTSAIGALCWRGSEIFCDRLNHASIIDGCILSGAGLQRYRHNDMSDLEQRLKKSSSPEKLIVTDSVFSMDGDRAKLEEICELGERYGAVVMVDEAHAAGIFGKRASGLVEETETESGVHIRIGTLSKAVGGMGGFFAGTKELRDFFVNNARSLIYSTGLPHSVLAYNLAAVEQIRAEPERGKKVLNLAALFRNMLADSGFDTMDSTTQIVPVLTGNTQSALSLSSFLKDHGIVAPAIRKPTVPEGKERVRFSLHADLDQECLKEVTRLVCAWKKSTTRHTGDDK